LAVAAKAARADIPFERVTRFELVINLKTAKTLGLTLPRTLLVAADEVFELPTIGFIGERWWPDNSIPFLRRLGELGWVEGRNILFEFRWKDGSPEATRAFLAEFVRLKVDAICTLSTSDALEAKRATSVIPIVAYAEEPLRSSLVTSLARPGGNVTGVADQVAETASKRVGLLREVVPALRRLAIMTAGFAAEDVLQIDEVQAVAGALGIEVSVLNIRRIEDIALAFDTLKDRADALYITDSEFLLTFNIEWITTLALAQRLPAISTARYWPRLGALMSYGADPSMVLRRCAEMMDKILRGAKPADIPFEQVTGFELVINLKTAKVLGLTIPPTLLALADEVIE
jgi:putative tryptophan/tyrosine transport system substrate-binding protein